MDSHIGYSVLTKIKIGIVEYSEILKTQIGFGKGHSNFSKKGGIVFLIHNQSYFSF